MDDLNVTDWLVGLAGYGCVFVELLPGEKRTRRPWEVYERAHEQSRGDPLKAPVHWLAQGSGLGLLPCRPLWALDVDDPRQVDRVLSTLLEIRVITPYLTTPGGGAHFYFRLPSDFRTDGLKNHVCHPRDEDNRKVLMDWKFGPRTLLVAPGTVRKGKTYEPQCAWFTPAAVDPRVFLPSGRFWREHRPFVVDERPLRDRVFRAKSYLRSSRTPVSISGKDGSRTLRGIVAHLVVFLRLDPALAFFLMTHETGGRVPWNQRCIYPDGTTYPWDPKELYSACEKAVDAVPAAGEKLYHRLQERENQRRDLAAFIGLLQECRGSSSCRVMAQDLVHWFGEWSGREITVELMTPALVRAGFTKVRFTHARLRGFAGVDAVRFLEILGLGVMHPRSA